MILCGYFRVQMFIFDEFNQQKVSNEKTQPLFHSNYRAPLHIGTQNRIIFILLMLYATPIALI